MISHPVRERCAKDIIADDIYLVALTAHFVDCDNVRMCELRCRASFAEELRSFNCIQLPFSRNLDGDNAIEFVVTCLPHRAKGPNPNLFQKLEVPDGLPFGLVCQGLFADKAEAAPT